MALQTIVPPPRNTAPFNTGDSPELGDQPAVVVAKINAMMSELYGDVVSQEGTTTVNFGAFPGKQDTTASVAAANIAAGSNVNAWLVATATADHSVDEHWVDPPIITAGNIVPGVGFTIYAISRDGGLDYGQWTVQWAWN